MFLRYLKFFKIFENKKLKLMLSVNTHPERNGELAKLICRKKKVLKFSVKKKCLCKTKVVRENLKLSAKGMRPVFF